MSVPHFSGSAVRVAATTLSPHEQGALVDRLQQGETWAEETLVGLFTDRIAKFVRTRTHDSEAARDLTQDVLLSVIRAVREGHLRDKERLGAFVFGTARNLTNNFVRTRSSQPPQDPLDTAVDQASVSDPAEETERALLVRRALGMLDVLDRKILLLTLVEGLKPGEIATRLGLTSEIVRTRKSRALKRAAERVQQLSRA